MIMKSIAVIGLGYVGLPLARRAYEAGYAVHGIDTNEEALNQLRVREHFFYHLVKGTRRDEKY